MTVPEKAKVSVRLPQLTISRVSKVSMRQYLFIVLDFKLL
jgi:hypothetical protein